MHVGPIIKEGKTDHLEKEKEEKEKKNVILCNVSSNV